MRLKILTEEDPFLDGNPEDFPQREEAMLEYRALWTAFLMGSSEKSGAFLIPALELRNRMDELQLQISYGPGKVWQDFKKSMPGYNEWWNGLEQDILKTIPCQKVD